MRLKIDFKFHGKIALKDKETNKNNKKIPDESKHEKPKRPLYLKLAIQI